MTAEDLSHSALAHCDQDQPACDFEAIIVGTGFGGAVSACRLAKKWGDRVLVLERGRRFRRGEFPRSPGGIGGNVWNLNGEHSGVPRYVKKDQRGMFDIRSFKRLDAVVAAGYGGGSLIYSNVIMEPPDEVFDQARWPASCHKDTLANYYDVVRDVLQARTVPLDGPGRQIGRTKMFQDAAVAMGKKSELVDVAVFFGNDPDHPLPKGAVAANRHGVDQTSCTYCSQCNIGCNEGAKNTLDMNYLHVAEHRYHATIRTDSVVEQITPLDDSGRPHAGADGTHGFQVIYHDIETATATRVTAQRVVVSAGSLGSTELLLRCRDIYKTLPRLSSQLGRSFSANGDFLAWVMGVTNQTDPIYGPTITQRIDHNLFEHHDPHRGFIIEDTGIPPEIAWMMEGMKPGVAKIQAAAKTLRHVISRALVGRGGGRIGYVVRDMMAKDVSGHAAALLCMGVDNAQGVLKLSERGWLQADWPGRANLPLYRAIVSAGKRFKEVVDADRFASLPTWLLPFRRNVTVHSLGGCVLADRPSRGVVNAASESFGEVFGYRNLSVADGAIVPAAVGSNPSATIAALSEMVAERITGIVPTADL